MSNRYKEITKIASGQTTSEAVSLKEASIVGIIIPSAFTGTSLTFMVSEEEGGTYKQMTRGIDGASVTALASADDHIAILIGDFLTSKYIKLVSSASEAADREIELIMKHV